MMQRHQSQQLEWLEFELLADIPHVKHAVYLRHGGVSQGPFASLNTAFHVGDNEQHVHENIQRIKTHLQQEMPNWSRLVWGRATHDNSIALIEGDSPSEMIDYDGLITTRVGTTLMMKHADCQVALFYDPIQHAAACIHAGWRGSVKNIYTTTIAQMEAKFGSKPSNLLVCISPSLGPDEAEFINYSLELPEDFWKFQVRPTFFDFWSISEYQLQNAGILPHHIEVARLSTYANAYDYFSYRREKTTGRHASCITLL